MSTVRLYFAPAALLLWAAVWAVGLTGDGVIVTGLIATAVGLILNIQESTRRHLQ